MQHAQPQQSQRSEIGRHGRKWKVNLTLNFQAYHIVMDEINQSINQSENSKV